MKWLWTKRLAVRCNSVWTLNITSLLGTCPDHTTRGNLCKHLLFVLIRAIGMEQRTVMEQ